MKKTTSLFILFLSIHTLHGMKRNLEPEKSFPLAELPIEAKAVVTQAIYMYDDLDAIIATIDATKCINKQFNGIVKHVYGNYNNIKEFTSLVHLLSYKFPEVTTKKIAKKFEIPAAQKYIKLGKKLLNLSGTFSDQAFDDAKQIIKDGADVNFTTSFIIDNTTEDCHTLTPFLFAMQMHNPQLIKLLTTSGIKEKTILTTLDTLKKIQAARAKSPYLIIITS